MLTIRVCIEMTSNQIHKVVRECQAKHEKRCSTYIRLGTLRSVTRPYQALNKGPQEQNKVKYLKYIRYPTSLDYLANFGLYLN